MRLVETRIDSDRVRQIMAEAHVERSRAIGVAIVALGRSIAGLFRNARMSVRRAAGVAEPCAAC